MGIYVKDVQKGIRVSSNFAFFRPFCEAWLDCLIEYEKRVEERTADEDWPFWYGERPLVGFFTAAIWRSGSVCIEEYQTDKKADAAQGDKDTYLGRGDLYFCDSGQHGNIEFKMHNIGINRTHHFANFLRRKWEEGVEDATKARQRGIPSYGGMFLRPYVGIAPDIPRYNANLKSLLKTAWDIVKPDALAWRCPTAAVVGKGGPKKKDWVIGVILLIKHVK